MPANPGGVGTFCCPCATTFACGTSATCDARTQVCEHVQGGPPPGVDEYACIAIPTECATDATCACVTNALRGRGATACASGGIALTVQIDVP